jgi:ferredoxin
MQIDIRDGAYQIECTRCGTCIDACDTVLARLKTPRPGLLAFRMPTFSLGTIDIKRVLVSLATIGFGVAFALAVGLRSQMAFVLSPVYTTGEHASTTILEAQFLLRASNRGRDAVSIAVRPEGLPDSAEVLGIDDPVVPAGTEKRFQLTVRLPLAATESSVTPFVLVIEGGGESKEFAAALLAHGRRSTS